MQKPLSLEQILSLTAGEFGVAFYDYLVEKKNRRQTLHPVEEEAWLVLTMQFDIEMEGFVDLFYQLYSLRDCAIVDACLKKLGLHRLAELFLEAKQLYVGGQTAITEAKYQSINPWKDTLGKNDGWSRFEAIEKEFLAPGSELFMVWDRVESYVKDKLRPATRLDLREP